MVTMTGLRCACILGGLLIAFFTLGAVVFEYLKHENRMSVGLGMSKGEWEELKSKVDDSFWVMRVIGKFIKLHKMALYHIQVV